MKRFAQRNSLTCAHLFFVQGAKYSLNENRALLQMIHMTILTGISIALQNDISFIEFQVLFHPPTDPRCHVCGAHNAPPYMHPRNLPHKLLIHLQNRVSWSCLPICWDDLRDILSLPRIYNVYNMKAPWHLHYFIVSTARNVQLPGYGLLNLHMHVHMHGGLLDMASAKDEIAGVRVDVAGTAFANFLTQESLPSLRMIIMIKSAVFCNYAIRQQCKVSRYGVTSSLHHGLFISSACSDIQALYEG